MVRAYKLKSERYKDFIIEYFRYPDDGTTIAQAKHLNGKPVTRWGTSSHIGAIEKTKDEAARYIKSQLDIDRINPQ